MPLSEQGIAANRYMNIPRTLVFLIRENHILLIRGAPTKRLWAGKYNGVGGHIEPGEDVYSAATREVIEEAGISTIILRLSGIISIDTKQNPGILIFVFVGQTESTRTFTSSEGLLEWISLDKYKELPLVEDLPELIPHILQAYNTRSICYGKYFYSSDGSLRTSFFDPDND